MILSRESQEGRTFQRHAIAFEEEEDCSCILEKISDSRLLEDGTLKGIKRSVDKKSKNRYVAGYVDAGFVECCMRSAMHVCSSPFCTAL